MVPLPFCADGAQWKNRGPAFGHCRSLALSLACNAMMLISSEAVWRMQMGGGLALFVPLCLLLLEGTRPEQGNKARWLVLVLAFLVVYGNVYMMAVDQEAMQAGPGFTAGNVGPGQ